MIRTFCEMPFFNSAYLSFHIWTGGTELHGYWSCLGSFRTYCNRESLGVKKDGRLRAVLWEMG